MENQMSYTDEPEEIFHPLPDHLYRELYDLEMEGFRDDFRFYRDRLSGKQNVLELGCGSGRITHHLAENGFMVTGCDISLSMLKEAQIRQGSREQYVCMDMRQLGFLCAFDGILIPYNTLNLLYNHRCTLNCLEKCRSICHQTGKLLFQVFTPTSEILDLKPNTKAFQFQIFDRPLGGKIVKETLRQYHKSSNLLTMTERYRIRPMTGSSDNRNYCHTYQLHVPKLQYWQTVLLASGFEVQSIHNEYRQGCKTPSGTYLITAVPR